MCFPCSECCGALVCSIGETGIMIWQILCGSCTAVLCCIVLVAVLYVLLIDPSVQHGMAEEFHKILGPNVTQRDLIEWSG